jgi:transcriptional regulator with XRE-family HTH domain
MAEKAIITGRLVAAARVLTGVSRSDLADASGISISRLSQIEAAGSAALQSEADAQAVRRALENFGAMFVAEGDGFGAGVRLKFLRQDVKQIGRLEGEGGLVGSDDVP